MPATIPPGSSAAFAPLPAVFSHPEGGWLAGVVGRYLDLVPSAVRGLSPAAETLTSACGGYWMLALGRPGLAVRTQ
jgi:hypothetical protein